MNAEQANTIDLLSILQNLSCIPVKQKGHEYWYNSPFRNEKTASFHVHASKNIWYDFGDAKGGTVIDFVCAYLDSQHEDHTVSDALRWLNNMKSSTISFAGVAEDTDENDSNLTLKKILPLQNPLFIRYLESRGIPFIVAKKYLKEAEVFNSKSGKSFFAISMRNEDGGYELRNKFFKGCIAPKDVSFLRGTKFLFDEIHIFEGFMDFLSALVHLKKSQLDGDVIILNSIACIKKALPYISNYSYQTLYSWLDNDPAGAKGNKLLYEFTLTQADLSFKEMNKLYAPHKDVNEWHMKKLEL